MQLSQRELDTLIEQLIETLHQELYQHRRFLAVVRRRKEALASGNHPGAQALHATEKEVLADVVTFERERIALVTELGEILGHPRPARLRIAELVLHSSPEGRDELLDLRDEFRDLADEHEALTAVEPLFSRHYAGQVRLYMAPSRAGSALGDDLVPAEAESRSGSSSGKPSRTDAA